MAVTCAVCNKKFSSLGVVADHISETNKGIQGDIIADTDRLTADMEQLSDAMRGFAHVRYFDKNSKLISESEVTQLYVLLTAGAKWCTECREQFPNNFRLYEHYASTNHGDAFAKTSKDMMIKLGKISAKWF